MRGPRFLLPSLVVLFGLGGSFQVRADEPPAADPECLAYCAASEAACSRHARQVAQACSREAATGGVDPFTRRRALAASFCGYFLDPGNCLAGRGQAACVERFRARHLLCNDAYLTNTASEYLKCSDGERTARQVCREELSACRASC